MSIKTLSQYPFVCGHLHVRAEIRTAKARAKMRRTVARKRNRDRIRKGISAWLATPEATLTIGAVLLLQIWFLARFITITPQ